MVLQDIPSQQLATTIQTIRGNSSERCLLLGLLGNLACALRHWVCSNRLARGLGLLQSLNPEVLLLGQLSVLLHHSGVRVQLKHSPDVLEGVGPDHGPGDLAVGGAQHCPDGLRLEQSGEICVGHLWLGKVPASLGCCCLSPCAVKPIKFLKCRLSPDAEPANVAAWGELQQVQVVNLDDINTRDVPESLGDTLVLVIDDEGAQLLHMTPAPQLALAGAHTAGGVNLGDIGPSLVPPEELNSLLCASEALDGVGNHQRHLRDSIDDVSLCHDECWHSSCGDGGAHGVPLLGNADLPVPPSPLLGGSEHASSSAHVSKGSLARPVGTATPDPWDPSNSTTSSPRLGRGLVTSRLRHAVGLTLVLGNVVVHQRDDVRPDRSSEDSWETDGGPGGSILVAVDANQRPRRCQRHLGFSCRSESSN